MAIGEEVRAVLAAGADMVHFDVMDNHYVPNLTIGPFVCKRLRQAFPRLVIDVHLMAVPVDALIEDFVQAGASRISIHPDATAHLDRSLERIQQLGLKAGIALNPATSPDCLQWCMHRLDFVLMMTVNPGFGGQKLIPEVIDKIAFVHQHYPHLPICVDGGVTLENMGSLAKAGASQFVAGSAIFSSQNYQKTISAMRSQLP